MLGLPEEPTQRFLLGLVANSQCCQSPSHGQSQQKQHSQVRTRQPWGSCHLPQQACSVYLLGQRGKVFACAAVSTGVLHRGWRGGRLKTAILQQLSSCRAEMFLLMKSTSSSFLKAPSCVWKTSCIPSHFSSSSE